MWLIPTSENRYSLSRDVGLVYGDGSLNKWNHAFQQVKHHVHRVVLVSTELCRRCSYDWLCIFVVLLSFFGRFGLFSMIGAMYTLYWHVQNSMAVLFCTGKGLGDILGHFENNAQVLWSGGSAHPPLELHYSANSTFCHHSIVFLLLIMYLNTWS